MEPVYTLIHPINRSEVDFLSGLKTDILFSFMQQAASDHSELLGLGQAKLDSCGIVWMLACVQMHLDRQPMAGDVLRLETWCSPFGSITQLRSFRFYCGDVCIGQASSSWMLVDREKRKILSRRRLPFTPPEPVGMPPALDEPARCRFMKPEGAAAVMQRTPRYSDIDTNGHMNNTCYVRWIDDLFSLSCYETEFLSDLTVYYSSEATFGTPVSLFLTGDAHNFCAAGEDGQNRLVFEARGAFAPRSIKRKTIQE